jgi:hypothetical protein
MNTYNQAPKVTSDSGPLFPDRDPLSPDNVRAGDHSPCPAVAPENPEKNLEAPFCPI